MTGFAMTILLTKRYCAAQSKLHMELRLSEPRDLIMKPSYAFSPTILATYNGYDAHLTPP